MPSTRVWASWGRGKPGETRPPPDDVTAPVVIVRGVLYVVFRWSFEGRVDIVPLDLFEEAD